MAYYNPYPYYNHTANIPQVQPPQQSASGGLIWVQGEAGAKSYLVAPNTTVLLMDSENNCFYLKSSDASGMPMPLRVFSYTEKTNTAQNAPQAKTEAYVTREEFEAFKASLKETEEDHEQLHL